MNVLKTIVLIVALCSIDTMDARAVKGAPTPAAQPQPTPIQQPLAPVQPPVVQVPVAQPQPQPLAQPQSYAQALAAIRKNMSPENVVVNGMFTPQFVNFVTSLNLSDIETRALFEAGAHIHTAWTDNNESNKLTLLTLRNNIRVVTQPQPIPQPKEQVPQRISADKVHRELLGKVKKLEGNFEIYVGAGTSPAGEPIFFAMEKLNDENVAIWKKYLSALYNSYYTQAVKRLYELVIKCDDRAFLETLKGDLYTTQLMDQMCPRKAKFASLFGRGDGGDSIGGGIIGLDQMIARKTNEGDVIYIAYASNQPITGPFKPKKELDVSAPNRAPSFTLEDFEIAYSNIIMCVAVDMMPNLRPPITTEHRGIFKNPFNEIRDTYKNISMKLHGWAATVEEQFFNKKYTIIFPTYHAAKLLHKSFKNGGLYLGTDTTPFPYANYYKNPDEQELIKAKFPPIKQALIGNAPTVSGGGILEDLHVFELKSLSKYYTGK